MQAGTYGSHWYIQYNSDLFDRPTIEAFLEHYRNLLEAALAAPDVPVSALGMIGGAERERLLSEWSDRRIAYPADRCVHTLFDVQAARSPDAVAVVYGETACTYAELERRANQLAHLPNQLYRRLREFQPIIDLLKPRSQPLCLLLNLKSRRDTIAYFVVRQVPQASFNVFRSDSRRPNTLLGTRHSRYRSLQRTVHLCERTLGHPSQS